MTENNTTEPQLRLTDAARLAITGVRGSESTRPLKIDKTVPVPAKATRSRDVLTVRRMKVGDSILCLSRKQAHLLRIYLCREFGPRSGSTGLDDRGNLRVWRVK